MRKLIVALFILLISLCGAVLYGPAVSLVPEKQQVQAAELLPLGVQEDVAYVMENKELKLEIGLSHNEYFYDNDIEVEIISNNPEAEIYYTLDGSTPTKDSTFYTKAIDLTANEEEKCTVIRVIATDGESESEVLTHSYVVGKKVYDRFITSYVFSLSTDASHFYDYETGILVPGKKYDDYIEKHPEDKEITTLRQGNHYERGIEWERPVFVESFTSQGERIIAQNAGVRVHGGATREKPQKSLRLIARKQYEPKEGKFEYAFYDDYFAADDYRMPITSFDSLTLRNSGNDWKWARIRNSLATVAAKEAGYDVVTPYESAAVFINGEYYGYATVDIRINEQFLEDLYNAPERSFDIYDRKELNELVAYAEKGDIEELEKHIDIENFLLYCAIEAYVGNSDWPLNNVKVWRYTGPQDAENLAEELDGRWRYVLFDMDYAMSYSSASKPDVPSIHRLLYDDEENPISYYYGREPILAALLEDSHYAGIFASNIMDLTRVHFTPENVEKIVKGIDEKSFEELEKSAELYNLSMEKVIEDRELVAQFFEERPEYILQEIEEIFGYTEENTFIVRVDESCHINTIEKEEETYFVGCEVPIKPVVSKGLIFDHWIVNGEDRFEKKLAVKAEDVDHAGVVRVKAAYRQLEQPLLFIDTYDDGELFGFKMINPTEVEQNTQNLYLSDDAHNLKKWEFPILNIKPDGVWDFVGENATSYDALLKVKLNFNPREGETIFLSNESGEVLDYILIQK